MLRRAIDINSLGHFSLDDNVHDIVKFQSLTPSGLLEDGHEADSYEILVSYSW